MTALSILIAVLTAIVEFQQGFKPYVNMFIIVAMFVVIKKCINSGYLLIGWAISYTVAVAIESYCFNHAGGYEGDRLPSTEIGLLAYMSILAFFIVMFIVFSIGADSDEDDAKLTNTIHKFKVNGTKTLTCLIIEYILVIIAGFYYNAQKTGDGILMPLFTTIVATLIIYGAVIYEGNIIIRKEIERRKNETSVNGATNKGHDSEEKTAD